MNITTFSYIQAVECRFWNIASNLADDSVVMIVTVTSVNEV